MEILRTNLDAALDETLNNFEIELRPEYHGRFGAVAQVAVVGESDALEEFELYLAALMVVDNIDFDGVEEVRELLNTIIDVRGERREDNMGMDRIYYYPNITVLDNR